MKLNQPNKYILLYRRSDQAGRYSSYPNVTELVCRAPSKLWWDQVTVPYIARAEKLDVIFNPKLSVPLFTNCATVLVMHGAEQFAVPHAFPWYDRAYFSIANRLFCRCASAIVSMTQLGARDIAHYMGADPRKIHVIPESYNEHCRVVSPKRLKRVKKKYGLPDPFLLFVGGLSPLKNLGNVLRALALLRHRLSHKLVVIGFNRWNYKRDLDLLRDLALSDRVIIQGFVDDRDIAAFYNLADGLVFPTLYEGFGMPVLEAMACGCPVITSDTGCSPEVAGDAALLVPPGDPQAISEAILKLTRDAELRNSLVKRGRERVRSFSWKECARQTHALFKTLARKTKST